MVGTPCSKFCAHFYSNPGEIPLLCETLLSKYLQNVWFIMLCILLYLVLILGFRVPQYKHSYLTKQNCVVGIHKSAVFVQLSCINV